MAPGQGGGALAAIQGACWASTLIRKLTQRGHTRQSTDRSAVRESTCCGKTTVTVVQEARRGGNEVDSAACVVNDSHFWFSRSRRFLSSRADPCFVGVSALCPFPDEPRCRSRATLN